MDASAFRLDLPTLLETGESGEISCAREAAGARWTCGDRSTIVTFRADGRLEASFVDGAALDEATGSPVRCVYRSTVSHAYELTHLGCARMVEHMSAFFAGAREPHFTFVGTHGV